MPKLPIAKLERLPLKKVWPHEERDLTPWLLDNLDALSEALETELTPVRREQPAGDFRIDLVAEDAEGASVIIENQFGRSNHDHLGKLITYAAATEARAAVWVVEEARSEHTEAVNWLNKAGGTAFYLVKLEAVRIGDSAPAPLFTLIVGPSEGLKQAGEIRKEAGESDALRRRWWTALLAKANEKLALHRNITPPKLGYIKAASGARGLFFCYVTTEKGSRAELYLDSGDRATNKAAFDRLADDRADIEKTFGGPLVWERLDSGNSSRIKCDLPGTYSAPESEWPATHARMVDAMARLEKALRPHLDKLAKG